MLHNCQSDSELDEFLSRPTVDLVRSIPSIQSPLLLLGAGGKMGPTLALMAKRAAEAAGHKLEIIAVSGFNNPDAKRTLEDNGIKTIACNLLDESAVQHLPNSANIIYLVGLKFGTAKNPAATWAANTIVPARVCERYPSARIVALSTGNVYPLTEVQLGGAVENSPLTPLGEYPNAAIARERIFEFYSTRNQTPVTLLRLFYAIEPRYGVLADIARKVFNDEPIELATGSFNCIWQPDANEMILRSLDLAETPPAIYNLCRPEIFSVRTVARQFGAAFGKEPRFSGVESNTALLGNSSALCAKLGAPATQLDAMISPVAQWIKQGGRDLGRPTHFEVRDGKY